MVGRAAARSATAFGLRRQAKAKALTIHDNTPPESPEGLAAAAPGLGGDPPSGRGWLALFGALAGLALWGLNWLGRGDADPRLALVLYLLVLGFFGAALLLAGQSPLRRVLLPAAGVALVLAGLGHWAGLRFEGPGPFLQAPGIFAALAAVLLLPLPFLALRLGGPSGGAPFLAPPKALFTAAWTMVLRFALAWVFLGLAWLLLLLSHQLLDLVGLSLIEDLLDDWPLLAWVGSGAALGLGLAVTAELLTPAALLLPVRLLRLLLPPALLVLLIFLAALPLRGLSGLFGARSAAAVLGAISLCAAFLVAISLPSSGLPGEGRGAGGRDAGGGGAAIGLCARLMALVLPVPAALSLAAVVIRVQDYGWTPPRLAAALGALIVLAYGLCYAVLALRAWPQAIGRANRALMLVVLGLAMAWLTPLGDTGALSAQDQIARYRAGRIAPDALPLEQMRSQWGRGAARAYAGLAASAQAPGADPALVAALAADRAGQARQDSDAPALLARLRAELVTLAGPDLAPQPAPPDWLLAGLDIQDMRRWLAACDQRDDQGRVGCVLVLADFLPDLPGDEALAFLASSPRWLQREAFARLPAPAADGQAGDPPPPTLSRPIALDLAPGADMPSPQALLQALHERRAQIGPPRLQALQIEGISVMLSP